MGVGVAGCAIRYKGPIHAAATIVREEGPGALWKGVVPTMVRQGSNQAFNFMAFYAINNFLYGKRDGDSQVRSTAPANRECPCVPRFARSATLRLRPRLALV